MPMRAQNRLNVLRLLDREQAISRSSAISLQQHLKDAGMEDGVYLETMRDLMRLRMVARRGSHLPHARWSRRSHRSRESACCLGRMASGVIQG